MGYGVHFAFGIGFELMGFMICSWAKGVGRVAFSMRTLVAFLIIYGDY